MKYGTKKDIVFWYLFGGIVFWWGFNGIIAGDSHIFHWAAIPFLFGCVMQPARNAKKREKKRKQEIMEKAFENLAKGE